jgi:surfeit locus 1 family protein
LDRLAQRRAFNAHIESVWVMPPLNLTADTTEDLTTMEYRDVVASGRYDYPNQVALRNMYSDGQYGYHLLTPLVMGEGVAVIVDRGWIPAEGNGMPDDWRVYDEEADATVQGILRVGQEEPEMGGIPDPELAPGQTGLDFWMNPNLDRLGEQLPYDILPIYIQPDPDPTDSDPPIPFQPEIVLTEGAHIGYAVQWFSFATVLCFGYPFYLRKHMSGQG